MRRIRKALLLEALAALLCSCSSPAVNRLSKHLYYKDKRGFPIPYTAELAYSKTDKKEDAGGGVAFYDAFLFDEDPELASSIKNGVTEEEAKRYNQWIDEFLERNQYTMPDSVRPDFENDEIVQARMAKWSVQLQIDGSPMKMSTIAKEFDSSDPNPFIDPFDTDSGEYHSMASNRYSLWIVYDHTSKLLFIRGFELHFW